MDYRIPLLIACLLVSGAVVLYQIFKPRDSGELPEQPEECEALDQQTYSSVNPASFWEENNELSSVAPLRWIGNWRSSKAVPTQHFAINQVKSHPAPMILGPYSAVMDGGGIVYDAYTLDRWSDPDRSSLMLQQTPHRVGAPWDVVRSVGTNMRQMTTGPDGHPTAAFSGLSGVRVGFEGIQEPTWTDFGDLYADFTFGGTGEMMVPLVRGSAMLTHRFTNANPLLSPYCLSSINGHSVSYECPTERDAADGGSGFLEGNCTGNELTIILRATKRVDINLVQWAADSPGNWPAGMRTCGDECSISPDGLTVTITSDGFFGETFFAINVIGRYVLPIDWTTNPLRAQCDSNTLVKIESQACEFGLCHTPSCSSSGGSNDITITIDLDDPVPSLDRVQMAVSPASSWGFPSPMLTCGTNIPCVLSEGGKRVTYSNTFSEDSIKYAINIIEFRIFPPDDWINNPYEFTCDNSTQTPPPTGPTSSTTVFPGQEIARGRKFVLELDEPRGALPSQTRKYVVYFSSEVSASAVQDGRIQFAPVSGGKYTGLLQLVYAGASPRGDMSGTEYFDRFQGVFPFHPVTSFCAQGDKGYVSFDWEKHNASGPTKEGELIIITMPHHEALLSSGGQLVDTPFVYKGFIGDSWLLEEDLPPSSMEPNPNGVAAVMANPEWHQNVLDAIERDTSGQDLPEICATSESYWVGKAISLAARLASISRAFNTDHYQVLDPQILTCLQKWLRIDDSLDEGNRFRYDTYYGGLLLRGGPDDDPINPNSNFGFPLYSDHHFHLGYHIYALGYYAKYYPSWASQHQERILALARDVANPSSSDKYFPVVRHKDFYVGSSWATGVVGGVRQAESSSEAIACYHGVAALGLALGDKVMEQTGQLMLATEIRSVREYYHVRAHNRDNFPPLIHDYGCIGMLGEESIFLYTLNWPCEPFEFPMRHACLVGIQVIPITSISYLYQDREWAGAVKNVCTWANDPFSAPGAEKIDPSILRPVNEGWGAFCHSAMAPYDTETQSAAAEFVKDMTPSELVSGTGAASTLLFIYAST